MRSALDSLCGRNYHEANVLDEVQGMIEADIKRLRELKRHRIETKRAKDSGLPKMQSVWPSPSGKGTAQLQIEAERGNECKEPETKKKTLSDPYSRLTLLDSRLKVE